MEKRYQSLSLFEFQQRFPDDQACMDYLASIKWPEGFICEKCGYCKYCKGKLKPVNSFFEVPGEKMLVWVYVPKEERPRCGIPKY